MTKEAMKEYSLRITQCSKSELVVITFEIMLDYMDSAVEAYQNEDMFLFTNEMKKAQKCISELLSGLNFAYSLSKDLMSLYVFINKKIIEMMIRKDISELDDLKVVINNIKSGFEEVAKEDESGPVMRNSQQVYVGLTYGRHSLNEYTMRNDY